MSAGTYPPLDVPKPVCPDLWVVDGPEIRFGVRPFRMPFPTRMTVIRIGSDLFLHSPTGLTAALRARIAALGTPRWIVAPNRIHYWWVPDWHRAFPAAEVWLAPGVEEQAKGRVDFPVRALEDTGGFPWDEALVTLPVAGRYMTEVVFFHPASRTLVLTDLIENFEPGKLGRFARWLARLGGAAEPGAMPRDMRLTYPRRTLAAAVERMIALDPERIVLAHGRWYRQDGAAELRRAFGWLLP
jgi:hypothetical protein